MDPKEMQCMDEFIQKIVQLDQDMAKQPRDDEFVDACSSPPPHSDPSS